MNQQKGFHRNRGDVTESTTETFGFSAIHQHSSWLRPHVTMATWLRIHLHLLSHIRRTQITFKRQKRGNWHRQEGQTGQRGLLDVCGVRGQGSRCAARGRHSSRLRPASRESTSARGARQKVKEVNWDRKSCRERGGQMGQTGAAAVLGPPSRTRPDVTLLILAGTGWNCLGPDWPPPPGRNRPSRRRSGPAPPSGPGPPAPTGPAPGLAASRTGRSRTGCLTCPSSLSLRTKTCWWRCWVLAPEPEPEPGLA